MAAATRVREVGGHPDATDERRRAMGLPAGMHPDDQLAISKLLELAESARAPFSTTILARIEEDDGSIRQVNVVVLGNPQGATTLIGDADEEIALDALTGLPGRRYLQPVLHDALQGTLDSQYSVGVFSIDIDRFKTFNDSHGYAAGDDALRALAAGLEAALRPDDTLARVGGDGFTVVCPEILGINDAMELAERFRAVRAGSGADRALAGITVSVGFAIGRADRSSEDLLREAETALSKAKDLGRDRSEAFDEKLRSSEERRVTVDQRLRQALEEDGIQVHYQPIVEVASRRIVGIEALLRIEGADPRLDQVEIVEMAEDAGLIRRIEEVVLRRAASTVQALPNVDDEPPFLSVNVSDRQLADSRFPLALARTLNAVDFPAEQLHLEINRDFLERTGAAVRLVTQLGALGVSVVVHKFSGTGDAELVVPDGIEMIKLDTRLVHGIHGERGRARAELVVSSILDAGVDACAVGVETEEDLQAIAELGCAYAQGFLFSPPVDGPQLETLLRRSI